ncbi:MAG: alpha/beta hydrolase [Gammaproteobacteria bacterium]|nr:alpha/beta hydrolase [Gammaproteobacteria bacterium]NNM14902.1 alpha/beta hydrolase [Gammaproteobacteria bacterium]
MSACATAQQVANQQSSLHQYRPLPDLDNQETVVLLHGLNRTARSMRPLASSLQANGYSVCNIDYPSRYFELNVLAMEYVLPRIRNCVTDPSGVLHFVTHSMGGMLVRSLDAHLSEFTTGHLVMLSPPNKGSEVVDVFAHNRLFMQSAGPAGSRLGTDPDSLPSTLPQPSMPFGVIAAKHSNSAMSWVLPGDDDGKVTLENMKLESMQDFIVIGNTHSFMMRDADAIRQVLHFLRQGKFKHN